MMKTYARYKYTNSWEAKLIGCGWHEITAEYTKYYPSGKHLTVIVNGLAVKARECELVQVFDK